jgi:hypothetical protein
MTVKCENAHFEIFVELRSAIRIHRYLLAIQIYA